MHTRVAPALLVIATVSGHRLPMQQLRTSSTVQRAPTPFLTAASATAAGTAKKAELLDAIADYNAATDADGVPSVDFGVKGGELDSDTRAPRDLLAANAFFGVSQRVGEAADRVIAAVDALTPENPTSEPLEGFGTPEGADVCPLHGRWCNMFTTAADATFSKDSKRGDASVSNQVDAVTGRTLNVIEFNAREHPAFRATRQTAPPPPLDSLKVVLSATKASANRVELIFRRVRARLNLKLLGLRFGLTLVLPVPGPFITRILFFFKRKKQPPPAFFDVLYLDDTLRVHRTGQGNTFVQRRAEA